MCLQNETVSSSKRPEVLEAASKSVKMQITANRPLFALFFLSGIGFAVVTLLLSDAIRSVREAPATPLEAGDSFDHIKILTQLSFRRYIKSCFQ